MNPRSAIQGRLGARCRSVQALQEVQAGGLLRTALWQPLPLLEPQRPALALWENQPGNLKQQLDPGVCHDWQQSNDFRASSDNDGANGNGGGIHQKNGANNLRLLIHFKRSDAIIQVCQLRLRVVL